MAEHINKFEVNNFKKFDHLTINNIGQVNLITGDNNVGKTCLLEALVLETNIKANLKSFNYFLYSRGFVFDYEIEHSVTDVDNNQKNNIVAFYQKDISKPITIKYQNNDGQKVDFEIRNDIIDIINTSDSQVKGFAKELEKYPEINSLSKNWILFYLDNTLRYMVDVTSKYYNDFLTPAGSYHTIITLNDFFRDDLIDFYITTVSNIDAKKDFLKNLNNIFRNDKIIDIQASILYGEKQITIATELNSNFHSITQYGSGFIRLFRIILEIMLNANKYLMIDEIDTGIHFSRMKEEWALIFKLAKQTNTQLFATTHSSDCIKAFVEAAQEDSNIRNDLRLIELEEFVSKNGHNVNKATTYDYDTLKFKLETDTNVRGGNAWQ